MPEQKQKPIITRLANMGMIVFGGIMMTTPLTLWIAPSKPWFYFILEAFAISSVMVWFLSGFETTAAEHQATQKAKPVKATLSDQFVEKMQNLGILERNPSVQEDLKKLAEKHRSEIQKPKDD